MSGGRLVRPRTSRPGPFRLVIAGRPRQPDVLLGQFGFAALADVVLVSDQRVAGPGGDKFRFGGEEVQRGLAFVSLA